MSTDKTKQLQAPQTLIESTYNGLVNAINYANTCDGTTTPSLTIEITQNITLEGNLPVINTQLPILTITGSNNDQIQIDGQGSYQGFVVLQCASLLLQQLTLYYTSSRPEQGCLGAGGGIVLNGGTSAPGVQLDNVSILHCSAFGGDAVAGAIGGYGGSVDNNTSYNGDSGDQSNPSPANIFGDTTTGDTGVAGQGGNGGSGGNAGERSHTGPGGNGSSGQVGGTGADGGYGSGGGPGGGGGGGGAGALGIGPGQEGSGGAGASGGNAGAPGYGGGASSISVGSGEDGQGPSVYSPGYGGLGGNGASGGAGAGLGGGLFLMDNANLLISGSGSIDSNEVVGGTSTTGNGGAAGTGIFLQGSGILRFNTNTSYLVNNPITDEKGVELAELFDAPTGFPPGSWGISMEGAGTLELCEDQQFCGSIGISDGIVDLTSALLVTKNEVDLTGGALQFLPSSASSLNIGELQINNSPQLNVNGYSTITATSLIIPDGSSPTLTVNLSNFSGKSLTILTTPAANIPSALNLICSDTKYKISSQGSSIIATKI